MAESILRYKCHNCVKEITDFRVKCAECSDLDLCLQCFYWGAEIGTHKKEHKYILMDYNFPIFQIPNTKWTAKLETSLLSAIDEHGYGNWENIANSLRNNFTPEEVEEHYNTIYVQQNIGKVSWDIEDRLNAKDHTASENGVLYSPPSSPVKIKLSTEQNQNGLLEDNFKKENDDESETLRTGIVFDVDAEINKEVLHSPPHSPVKIKRSKEQNQNGRLEDDCEKEYDDEAETLLTGLVFDADADDEVDKAVKLAVVDIYTRRLKERFYRKSVVLEHDLVSTFLQNGNNPQKPSSAKRKTFKDECESLEEFQEQMVPFIRFFKRSEFESFFQNLKKEKMLKNKIELMKSRKNGVNKNEDLNDEEINENNTEKKENKKKTVLNMSRKQTSQASNEEDEKGNLNSQEGKEADDKLKGKQLRISSLPGYKLLSHKEKMLCTSLKLQPSYYITLKSAILKADARSRRGKAMHPLCLSDIGLNERDGTKIVKFMKNCGWIKSQNLLCVPSFLSRKILG